MQKDNVLVHESMIAVLSRHRKLELVRAFKVASDLWNDSHHQFRAASKLNQPQLRTETEVMLPEASPVPMPAHAGMPAPFPYGTSRTCRRVPTARHH